MARVLFLKLNLIIILRAIEPFQGAATGVGGIHRDIFTMGARPIAALKFTSFWKS